MCRTHVQYQRGFTLIEALVAVLVLSFGLLGVAAMQLKAMQGGHVAYQRSLATLIAMDANERLWAALGAANGTCPDSSSVQGEWLTHWDTASALPTITNSTIANPGADACEYLITVTWSDERFVTEEVATLTYVTQLPGKPGP